MFDVTCRATYRQVSKRYRRLTGSYGNIPIALVANKVDVKDRKIKTKQITLHRVKNNLTYHEVSVKTTFNIVVPFLCLARRLMGDPDSYLVNDPSLPEELLPQYQALSLLPGIPPEVAYQILFATLPLRIMSLDISGPLPWQDNDGDA